MTGTILYGFTLGWSVAWPPGPINAQMIQRGLARGFWSAFALGAGASTGDFIWAVAVSLGAGAVASRPAVVLAMSVVSCLLLFVLAGLFFRGALSAWKRMRAGSGPHPERKSLDSVHGGYLLGITLALSGPWNVAFWLAVIGSQQSATGSALGTSLLLACSVIAGALTWCVVLNTAVKAGARFATPSWEIVTSAATGALMLWFGVGMVIRLLHA